MRKVHNRAKVGHEVTAEIVERWVNNPGIVLSDLAAQYGLGGQRVSVLLTDVWFFKQPTENTETIVIQSSINEDLRKTA